MSKLINSYNNVAGEMLTASIESLSAEIDSIVNTGVGVEAFDAKAFIGKLWEMLKKLIATIKAEIKAFLNKITLAKNKPNPRYKGMVAPAVIDDVFKDLKSLSMEAHSFGNKVTSALGEKDKNNRLFEELDKFKNKTNSAREESSKKIKEGTFKSNNTKERDAAYAKYISHVKDIEGTLNVLGSFEKMYDDADRFGSEGAVNRGACSILALAYRNMANDLHYVITKIGQGFNQFHVTDVA